MGRLFYLSVISIVILTGSVNRVAIADEFIVKTETVRDLKSTFATVETADVISARARIGGTVSKLAIDEGRSVREGAEVALVTDPKHALELRALSARIESARSQMNLADTAYKRARSLYASGAVAEAYLDKSKSDMEVARRNLDALEAERRVIEQRSAEGRVLAPASGRVLKVHAVNGAVVLPGEAIATIAAEGFVLRAQLPERHARFIREGDVVLVGPGFETLEGMKEGQELRNGIIRQVYPEIKQGRVIADIEVEELGEYFTGERVRVYVAAGERMTIVIPETYIKSRFGLSFVNLKEIGEVVVQTGARTEAGIEILSGIKSGDIILLPMDR